ncbi:MAG: TonB-dependent receptor, partial [Flavitalea sp.]
MRRLLLTLFIPLFFYTVRAQTAENFQITGKVTDSLTGLPLEYASLSIMIPGNKTPVRGTASDQGGHFSITQLKAGTYSIEIDFIGYRTQTVKNIAINKDKPLVKLKTITLSKNQEMMQGVVVTAQGKLIENKIDKMVFNAERDLTSQSGVATDILKKVPQVSVDVDGNVELSGSSNIRFLINGKPSSAFGSNISDVLQSIPASQIKSIEVITNPGAKYDAQGTGGIINIILKRNNAQGINGNVSLAAGTRAQNGSLNLNARRGTFGVNAFISGNVRPSVNAPSSSNRKTIDSI